MKRILQASPLLLLLSAPIFACDWQVTRRSDPMTDTVTCSVSSASAKVSFYRYGKDRPNVVVASPYRDPYLYIRIDDNKAVRMGNNAYDRQKALDELLPQLKIGQRIRTSFRDYPSNQEGDGAVCNLQQLLDAC